MNAAELTEQMYADFAKAQRAFVAVEKRKTARVQMKSGGSYSYTYADLGDVIDTVRETLAEYGFGFVQVVGSRDHEIGVQTRLLHRSGASIDGSFLYLPAGNTPQEAGAAITYARRYSLSALLGIATEEDTDAKGVRKQSAPAMEASADAGGRVDQASSASRESSGEAAAGSKVGPAVSGPGTAPSPDSSSEGGRSFDSPRSAHSPASSSEGTATGLGEGPVEPSATPAPGGGSSPFSPPPGKGKRKYPNAANDGHNHDFTRDGRCRLCGKPATAAQKIAAVEGTTADLGAA